MTISSLTERINSIDISVHCIAKGDRTEMTILRIINKLSWYFFMKMKLPISGIDNKVEDIIDNYYLIPALKEFDDKLSKGEFQIVSWDEYQKQKASALPI